MESKRTPLKFRYSVNQTSYTGQEQPVGEFSTKAAAMTAARNTVASGARKSTVTQLERITTMTVDLSEEYDAWVGADSWTVRA